MYWNRCSLHLHIHKNKKALRRNVLGLFFLFIEYLHYLCGTKYGTDMIQANELRLDNYIYKLGNVIQVENETFRNVSSMLFPYEPIPITVEWLLRFGAAPFFMNGLQTHFRIGLHMIRFDGDDFYLELGKGMNIELTHIHQLQNLYFALTQTELTLKW
jgi:hypothetical protein